MKQYKYNPDMDLYRRELQNMTKKDRESFKEYAQRWRELTAQVEPPLAKWELVDLFMDTLHIPFFEKMIGSGSSEFSYLVSIGERFKHELKSGKISDVVRASSSVKKFSRNF